jgi:hypothetical protein
MDLAINLVAVASRWVLFAVSTFLCKYVPSVSGLAVGMGLHLDLPQVRHGILERGKYQRGRIGRWL